MAADPLPSTEGRSLSIALAITTAVVVVALWLRLAEPPGQLEPFGGRIFAALVAAALADLAALTRRRAPGVSWFAIASSVGIAAVEVVGALRDAELVKDTGSTLAGLVVAVAALVAAAGVALANAVRPRLRRSSRIERLAAASVAAAFVAVLAAAAWTLLAGLDSSVAVSLGDSELSPVRVTGRLTLLAVGLGLVVGLFQDIGPGLARGWRRWRAGLTRDSDRSLAGHLADELVPWRAAQSQAREDERARLAADLHALVLPDLRRAASAVASTGAGPAAVGVQRALEDVEQLMHGRQSIVLDQFGLVPALEWLAERTEARTAIRVDLDLQGDLVDQRDAVPRDVARAAFRIALLAVDNVERHAGAATATIRLHVDPGIVELEIRDDGRASPTWAIAGGRGLSDMRAEVAATRGTLRLETEPSTRVEVTWRHG